MDSYSNSPQATTGPKIKCPYFETSVFFHLSVFIDMGRSPVFYL